ncbi:MAG: hypothetical protein UY07_C0016G0014 [Parcubacteria group bacterium GW2011_GWA1_47_8]|nr:MAG: hypothetical protein UY07_C0016G0014 [Parcubacteria group bacterium GW2011_GWA1_47_8]KKW07710.1 MAG: hypothetical protein UY42_C0008G0013 [Parcubacteria group bacterium GW2011_GWA2_49_16]
MELHVQKNNHEESPEPLILEPTTIASLQTLVKKGEWVAGISLGEDLESYLVWALKRLIDKPKFFSGSLALKFAYAQETVCDKKYLQEVGDTSLLLTGLFPERSHHLGVDASFFSVIGRTAFDNASQCCRRYGQKDLATWYQEARDGFIPMADVLLAAHKEPPVTPLHALELWKETGSIFSRNLFKQKVLNGDNFLATGTIQRQ